jgi:hypothetical protein
MFYFISNNEDFQYNKTLEKLRVTGNGNIIQYFSSILWEWKYNPTTNDSVFIVYKCAIQY